VRQVTQGIERRHWTHPHQVSPLLSDDLARIVALIGSSLSDLRDRALLLVGFFGALRRSEIVALNFDDVQFREQGLDLVIRKSKTDQLQAGRSVHLRSSTSALDPAAALRDWLVRARVSSGAIFRELGLHARLDDRAAARIVKKWASAIGLPAQNFSGHSLRAGFATSAALSGLDATLIARQTGHKSQQTVAAYVRLAERTGVNRSSD
jgi:integrase